MNKSFILFVITSLLCVYSCQKINDTTIEDTNSVLNLDTKGVYLNNELERYSVSLSDAKRYSELYKPDEAYSITPYVEGRDTLLYLINYQSGWMVVSGDRRLTPIVAEGTSGTIAVKEETGYGYWLKKCAQEVSRIKKDEKVTENEYSSLWKAISPTKNRIGQPEPKSPLKWVIREVMLNESSIFDVTVPPLLQTEWGQQAPWNNNYPIDLNGNNRCYVGCVAVAFAQVLYYWHYYAGTPTKLSHTVSCYSFIDSAYGLVQNIGFLRSDVTNNSSRWDDMAISATAGGNVDYVGAFMLDIGNMVNMRYSGFASGAFFASAPSCINSYYGSLFTSTSSFSESLTKAELLNYRPVVVRAYSNNYNVDHAWVIDGYITEDQYYSMLRYCEQSTNWGPDDEVYDTFAEAQAVYGFSSPYEMLPFSRHITLEHFHMNWGEDGDGNGVYTSLNWSYGGTVLKPANTTMCTIYYP